MWLKVTIAIVLMLAAGVAVAAAVGARRWEDRTPALRARLEDAPVPPDPVRYDPRELDGLPAPVQRFFRAALTPGQPMIEGVRVEHDGTFSMSDRTTAWKPFTSTQRVVVRRPGFDWDARIAMAPGLTAFVHDAYVAGEGILHAAIGGVITVADLRGTRAVAEGELLRFFAEAAWYPTALLPSQGITWEAVDDSTAKATLRDGDLTLTLAFHFNAEGLIGTVRAEARGRTIGGAVVKTPWEGRYWRYETVDGMQVPKEAEVAWVLPTGPLPYWRGRITRISYEFTR